MQKQRTIMKSSVTPQFSYCQLIWLFNSRRLNNKVNSIHERALTITYQDNASTFQELLNKDNFVSIHHINLQAKFIEVCLQKSYEKHLCPKQVRIFFAETIF